MATHVALLRGINLAGRNKLAMADLRAAVSSLGYSNVSTYIQSGNVLFSPPETETDAARLEAAISDVIASTFSLKIGVVVMTRDQLAAVISQNPYPQEPNPKYVHLMFLGADPDQAQLDRIEAANKAAAAKGSRDSVTVIGRTLYLHTPDGYGRSELAQTLSRTTLRVNGTARNLATAAKLVVLCGADA